MDDERAPLRIVGGVQTTEWDGVVHRLGAVGSTMDEARALWADGAPHGTVVTAEEQGAGRGRGGRVWVSPPGNLHMTVVLRGSGGPEHAPQLAFVAALAVAEAVDRLAGPPTALKWPNDIMRDGAKLAGILLERLEDGTVLAGIGMNVRHTPPALPYAVTSLRELGCPTGVDMVADAVASCLRAAWQDWRTHGFPPTLQRWMARGPVLGAGLTVRTGPTVTDGRYAGLRADGALLLDTAAGRQVVVAGDVQPCTTRPAGVTTA